MDAASVRIPKPVNMSGECRCPATAAALSSSTIPVHRQWPMFEASAVDRLLARASSASAK